LTQAAGAATVPLSSAENRHGMTSAQPPGPSAAKAIAADANIWFEWLRSTRHGGAAPYAATLAPLIAAIRDRVLDQARLGEGQSVADIGCGDGFAGLAALDRFATIGVTFVDISPALIAQTRAAVAERGALERCRFIVSSAQSIASIPDHSIDVVIVRAVLAYIEDRAAAIGEFRRILRPGGRISIVDPIFSDSAFAVAGLAALVHAGKPGEERHYAEFVHRFRSAQLPDSLEAIRADSVTNYNERDLLRLFETAGFVNIHLRLHIDSVPALPMPWEAYLASSPRAGTPTVGQILAQRFTARERGVFEQAFRPGVEAGTTIERNVNAYIFADAP
jgi:arsenite methyltransferase